MENLFEQATRQRLRFTSTRGAITTEDLWELKLEELDVIAKDVNAKLKASEEESFIGTKSKASSLLALKLEVLKHIIKVKLEEKDAAAKKQEKRVQKARLVELIEAKKNEELSSKSIEELKKELEALED